MSKICPACWGFVIDDKALCRECYEKEKLRLEVEMISAFNEPDLRELTVKVLKAMEAKNDK